MIVAPVYPAGEAPIAGADRDALVAGLRAHGHKQAIPLDGPEELAGLVKDLAKPGDYVVCLGAGSITQWAYALPAELKALRVMAFPTSSADLKARMPDCAGVCWPTSRSAN